MAKKEMTNRRFGPKEAPEFDQKIIDLARVTRVMAGGKRMRFRACVAIGNKKGQVGFGLAKGADVTLAVAKAATKAKKNVVTIPMINETIPHGVTKKFKAAMVMIKPAPRGTGIKAGGAVRVVLELGGVPNVVSKILGAKNKINNLRALILAIQDLRPVKQPAAAPKKAAEAVAPKAAEAAKVEKVAPKAKAAPAPKEKKAKPAETTKKEDSK